MTVTCGLSAPVGSAATCTSNAIVSSTGGLFTHATVTLAYTGTAVGPIRFAVQDGSGTELGFDTGASSPLEVDLTVGQIPDLTNFNLKGQATAASFIGFSGTATFYLT